MKLAISRRAALPAFLAAYAARLFLTLAVDVPTGHNGAWLSALLSGLLIAPIVMCVDAVDPNGRRDAATVMAAVLLVITLLDEAAVLSALTRSAGYLALNRVPDKWLALPLLLCALWCVHLNGDAVGSAALVWLRLFPALLAVVLLLQATHLNATWLSPVLGAGWQGAFTGGVRGAGCGASCAALLLLSPPEDKKQRSGPVAVCIASVAVGALLALHQMMTPFLPFRDGWLIRLDGLITNGRAPLYLQLPMIILWYGGLLHLLACEAFASAALLERLFPRLGRHACGLIATIICAALHHFLFPDTAVKRWLYEAAYILVALLCAATAFAQGRGKGGARECAQSL